MENSEPPDILESIRLGEQSVRVLAAAGFPSSGSMEQDFLDAFSLDLLVFDSVSEERRAFDAMAFLAAQQILQQEVEVQYA